VVSGLSSLPMNRDDDKAVCGAKIGFYDVISGINFEIEYQKSLFMH
jgi:hypothetical protein